MTGVEVPVYGVRPFTARIFKKLENTIKALAMGMPATFLLFETDEYRQRYRGKRDEISAGFPGALEGV